jgi:ubiquinone/menaquinone biosynthesis C-methylase UbiE
MRYCFRIVLLVAIAFLITTLPVFAEASLYEERTNHDPDGIGRFYMGREIAQVMGHQGAGWLERRSRESEEQPQKVITALELKPTDTVADIGAGTGFFSFRIAPRVQKVFAVDVQPEMIQILEYLKDKKQIQNVEPVLGTVKTPNLPNNSVDVALMVDAYHEFEYPREMMSAIADALKPGGKAVLVEYRGENPLVLIKGLHKMTQAQVKREMAAIGLTYRETRNSLPQQHVMIFQK